LKKGDLGGVALARFGKIPPTPLNKGGNIIYGQALRQTSKRIAGEDTAALCLKCFPTELTSFKTYHKIRESIKKIPGNPKRVFRVFFAGIDFCWNCGQFPNIGKGFEDSRVADSSQPTFETQIGPRGFFDGDS
jgi:hypothetical protein